MALPSAPIPPPELRSARGPGVAPGDGQGRQPVLPGFRNRRGRRQWGGREPTEKAYASMGPAVGLSAVATLFAGVVAYGTHPLWAQFRYGLDFILLSRQLQWPFIVLSLIATIALVATVIAGRRRAWWLIGLAPILALFGHRFATDPAGDMASVENPTFVAAGEATPFLADDDYVVGLTLEGKNYVYPYAALYSTPAVIHAQHDKRVLVMWSAPANRALAFMVSRDLKARELDVVSTPANALLLYNTSGGVFINGLTGRTPDGREPPGFLSPVPTSKMTWRRWRAACPETQVMVSAGRLAARAPRGPIPPTFPMPRIGTKHEPDLKVVVIGTEKPAAVRSSSLTAAPLNLSADSVPVVAFRDPATGAVRGFRRRVDDLSPRFKANKDPARKGVHIVDTDTNTGWNVAGVAVHGKKEFRGKRLSPVVVEDELYWGVMKFWYPDLQLTTVGARAPQTVIELNGNTAGGGTGTGTNAGKADKHAEPSGANSGTLSVRRTRPARTTRKKP